MDRALHKSADLVTFRKKSRKSHISQHPFENPAPDRVWKLYDMIEIIHGYVVSVILIKFSLNAMAKFLHFEFWFWHSFWFFSIYKSLNGTRGIILDFLIELCFTKSNCLSSISYHQTLVFTPSGYQVNNVFK